MAKFDPKKADLNKDGKLSNYEENVGKKRAAAMKMGHSPKKMEHSPMKKYGNGYAMKMGSKEVNSPSAFNMKDAANMAASPMMIIGDPKTKVATGPGAENYAGNKLEGVTVLSDPLFKHKKYKKALKSAQDEVSTAVIRKFKQDSARTGMTTGEYNNPYARYSVPQRSSFRPAKYNVDMMSFGDQPGVAPKMYMYGKNMQSGFGNKDRSGFKTNRSDLIGKYNKMSKEMFSERKKAIDLKFYGSK